MTDKKSGLTSSKKLSQNVLWNLIGTGAPLLVAIVAIPLLIGGLGLERFGVLTIAWVVVGYFSLFDLGIGRALTKLLAERLGRGHEAENRALIWTAMLLLTLLGIIGGIFVALLSPWLVGDLLKMPVELRSEAVLAFYYLAVSIPVVTGVMGLRGVLEAHQRFGLVNSVRIPLGISTFLLPIVVLPFSTGLDHIVGVLVIARFVSWIAYALLCLRVEPDLYHPEKLDGAIMRQLVGFGGWMTVSSAVSALMVYSDRFFIGAIISMSAVSFYATPYEVVSKLLIIPAAFMGVMFPAFSSVLSQDKDRAARLYAKTVNYIFFTMYIVVLIIVTFSAEGLSLWLGEEFAQNSGKVLQLLAVGVFVNGLANVPFWLVQSAGRPDLTAKLHVIELPFYLIALWWLLVNYGVEGAAVAWLLRASVDALILFYMASRVLSAGFSCLLNTLAAVCAALITFVVGALIVGIPAKLIFVMFVSLAFVIVTWFMILTEREKCIILSVFKPSGESK